MADRCFEKMRMRQCEILKLTDFGSQESPLNFTFKTLPYKENTGPF